MKMTSIIMLAASFILIVIGIILFANQKRFDGEHEAGRYNKKYIKINALGNIFIGFLGTILGAVDNFVDGNSVKILFAIVVIGGSILQRVIANKTSK